MFQLKPTPFHEQTSKLCLPPNWHYSIALSGAAGEVEAFLAPVKNSHKK
jgi:hypothetical protein